MRKVGFLISVLVLVSVSNCGNSLTTINANFEQTDLSAKESDGKVTVTVKLEKKSGNEQRLHLRYGGTADLGVDFRGPADLVIPSRTDRASFDIELRRDEESECPEYIVLELGGSSGIRRKLTITIEDSDTAKHRLSVGTPNGYPDIASAILDSQPGDVIEIADGVYGGDVAVIRTDDLVICGVGHAAQVVAAGRNVEGKGIWVVKGNRVRIENVMFSGATVPDKNGAGIRAEGNDLTVRHVRFVDNENGILAGALPEGKITVEHSEFIHGGAGDGLSHNIYIGKIKRFTARFNLFRDANVGHNVKSRAQETVLEYNRVMDGGKGNASYQVDLPNGGKALLLGNVIQQGPNAENWVLISYGAEGIQYSDNVLVLANNTIVNDRNSGRFVQSTNDVPCNLVNNVLSGKGDIQCAGGERIANVFMSSGFVDREHFDYRTTKGSAAIDAGIPIQKFHDFEVQPLYELWSDNFVRPRVLVGTPDAGAYEFQP